MNAQSKLKIVAVAGWAISALAILGTSTLLIAPEHRSQHFWYRVLWAQFLAALVWSVIGGFTSNGMLGRKAPRAEGGIWPSFGLVVFTYASLSFALMLFHSYLPENDFLNRYHLASQIALSALAGTLCIFLAIARTAAAHGIEPIPEGIRSPPELAAMLKTEESRLTQGCKQNDSEGLTGALKTLRERIQYSLPHVGEIGTRPEYKTFSVAVESVCRKLAEAARKPVAAENQTANFKQEISDLATKVELIADGLNRR